MAGQTWWTRWAMWAMLVALAGCGGDGKKNGPTEPGKSDVLNEVAGLIRNCSAATGRGPTKVTDLAPYETEFPRGFQAVKSGDVVIFWGSKVAGEGGGGSQSVVAHEKDVPTAGGFVVLQDGNVKQMTAAEFAAAPKAGK